MTFSSFSMSGVEIVVYRDDLNHPTVSGNKLHKLAPNIALAKTRNCSTVLSFGGPYSNHLHALAYACNEQGIASIGVVRGELHEDLTPTLQDCQQWGMTLFPLPRRDYREYQEELSAHQGCCLAAELETPPIENLPSDTLVIPEGGSNSLAIESLAKAYADVFQSAPCANISHAICATGTGASLAGLYKAVPESIEVIGIQAVAEHEATLSRIHQWLGKKPNTLSIEEGHLGGFGKRPPQLLEFINEFEADYGIPLDPIYNGKAMFKISKMIVAGIFEPKHKILYIHTGGLQGKRER